jgi:hypothetical protein
MQLSDMTHKCVEIVNDSKIKVAEKGKSVIFLNPQRVEFKRIKVDNCLVKTGSRADWIISKTGGVSVIVELKGRDVGHAIEQLFATLTHIDCTDWLNYPTKLLVICAKYPSFDTKVARAQVRARKLGTTLKIVCRSLECSIDQI